MDLMGYFIGGGGNYRVVFLAKKAAFELAILHFGVFVYEYLTMLKILIVPRTWGVNELEFGLYRTRKRTFFIPNPSRESYTLYLAVDLQLGMVMILDSKNVLNERFSSYLVRFGPSFPKY